MRENSQRLYRTETLGHNGSQRLSIDLVSSFWDADQAFQEGTSSRPVAHSRGGTGAPAQLSGTRNDISSGLRFSSSKEPTCLSLSPLSPLS